MPYYGMQLISDADLEHHGIKGQRWGIRRYQNADGSLTSAGKNRYGYGGANATSARTMMTLGGLSNIRRSRYSRRADKISARAEQLHTNADKRRSKNEMSKRANKLDRRAEKVERRAEKVRSKAKAEATISAARLKYDNRTSTGKMFMQNILFGGNSGETYRDARALGATRMQATFSTHRSNRKRALNQG